MTETDMKAVGFLMAIFIGGLALVILHFTYPTPNYSIYLLVIGGPMMGISAIVIWYEFFRK
ncbi:MAG: hypothetical protein ACREBI_09990 [Nitrosotalea sp.]